jgi:hypothetical protein
MIARGIRLLSGITTLVLCCTGNPCTYAGPGPGLQIIYTSPLPDSRYILPGTNIILRTDHAIGAGDATRLIRSVTGTLTGAHTCSARVSDDGRTVVCRMQPAFAPGEAVRVQIDTSIAKRGGPGDTGDFTFALAGQIPDYTAYRTQLRGADFPVSVARPGLTGTRGPSGTMDDVVLPNIDVTLSAATSPGYLFLSDLLWSVPTTPALLILRNDGSQVFARDLLYSAYDFKVQPNDMLTYFDDGSGTYLVMDPTCTVVDTIRCGNGYVTDPHELQILPDGHALLLGVDNEVVDMSGLVPGGSPNAVVVGCIIQELDRSKDVVFQWRSWDHYNVTDALHLDFTAGWIDDVHGNAVDIDADGNILFSSRHMNEITKINRQTGEIIWRLGGKNNQFRFINDPAGFSFQHAVRRIANGHITLFDNGNFHDPPFSRAVEYALDEDLKTATLVWQYRHTPDIFGFAMGSVQRMENGNTLIGWGAGNPTVTEVTSNGSRVFEMAFDNGVYSYRAFRYDWQPAITTTGSGGARSTYRLTQNYPNPFNPSTTIQFSIARQSRVRLEVFNLLGERVSTLVDEERPAGSYSERLDGTRLASGAYFYRLKTGDFTATRRMILLR